LPRMSRIFLREKRAFSFWQGAPSRNRQKFSKRGAKLLDGCVVFRLFIFYFNLCSCILAAGIL
jgi:hypothetical protein